MEFSLEAILVKGNLDTYKRYKHKLWISEDGVEVELRIQREDLSLEELEELATDIGDCTAEDLDEYDFIIIWE